MEPKESFPLRWPEGWPRTEYHQRTSAQFSRKSIGTCVAHLSRELRLLGATDIRLATSQKTKP